MLKHLEKDLLRSCFIFFLVTVTISVFMVGGVKYYKADKTKELMIQKTRLSDARDMYNDALENEQLIKTYEKQYTSIKQLSIFTEENRLGWIEALQKMARKIGLLEIKYSIGSQEAEESEEFKDTHQEVSLKKSDMKLSFVAAHEGDIVVFLKALSYANVGIFTPTLCELNHGDKRVIPEYPLLRSECNLRWFTIIEEPDIDPDDPMFMSMN